MRNLLLTLLKLAVSVALIAWALSGIEINEVVSKILDARIAWLVTAALFFALLVGLGTTRWHLVLRGIGVRLPAATTLRLFFVGMFFNQTLPSSIGGDATRVFYLWRAGTPMQTSVNSVLLDRIFGLVILILVTSALAPMLVARLDGSVAATGLILVLVAGWTAMVLLLVVDNRIVRRLVHFRLISIGLSISRDARSLVRQPAISGSTLLVSLAIHTVTVGIVWCLDHALGGNAGFLIYVAAMSPTLLLVSIPVSIAGWGVREQILVVLLGTFGVDPTHAVSVSILFGILLLVGGIPGGFIWLSMRGNRNVESSTKID